MVDSTTSNWVSPIRKVLALLLMLSIGVVLSPVLKSMLWGIIISILLSPLREMLLGRFPSHANSIVFLLVFGTFSLIGAPVVWGLTEIQSEIGSAYSELLRILNLNSLDIPDQVGLIPLAGPWLHDKIESLHRSGYAFLVDFKELIPILGRGVGNLIRELTTQAFQLVLIGLCSFFFLRDGTKALQTSRYGLEAILGDQVDAYLRLIRSTVYAVTFGLVGSAMAQGIVAAIGYSLLGLEAPLLLGVLSALASLVPLLGASLVWGPMALGMLLNDHGMSALGLAIWGLLVVHPTDNLLRPLLISHLMNSPFILIVLGIVGGLLSFGILGVFIGPPILAMGMMVWLQWAKPSSKTV